MSPKADDPTVVLDREVEQDRDPSPRACAKLLSLLASVQV